MKPFFFFFCLTDVDTGVYVLIFLPGYLHKYIGPFFKYMPQTQPPQELNCLKKVIFPLPFFTLNPEA